MIESVLGNGPVSPEKTHRVLVVDDDPDFLDAMVDTIKVLGYRVEGVTDSDSALSSLRREPAATVIADVSMPGMNGFSLLKVLKRSYPKVHVVMMTGHNLSEPAAAMIRDSANAYLTKPFSHEAVKAVLAQFGTAGA